MINKNIEEINRDILQALIDDKVLEHKTLEYKQALPSNSDGDKKEFLADISSFANASGGDLIFGMVQDQTTGLPKEVRGLSIENIDQEILRLENIIRTGIQPRLPSVTTSPPIPLENSKVALVIRVAKSWVSPHRVIHNDKFYSRSSNGKYPLDVGELRIAFNLSETIIEKVRRFNLDRASKIIANETPEFLAPPAKTALHLIPIISFNPAQFYGISIIASNPTKMPPMNSAAWNNRYNLDGCLTYSKDSKGNSWSYTQIFRSGIIEAVDASMLFAPADKRTIPSGVFEIKLVESLSIYLSILKTLGVEPPIFVFLDLFGVNGYSMAVPDVSPHETHTIDRNVILLPEAIVESYDEKAEYILKPSFDSIWNACGFSKSFNYNDAGGWAPR
ncbi:MAG: ATP-binding protein [Chloroflexota bacterium]